MRSAALMTATSPGLNIPIVLSFPFLLIGTTECFFSKYSGRVRPMPRGIEIPERSHNEMFKNWARRLANYSSESHRWDTTYFSQRQLVLDCFVRASYNCGFVTRPSLSRMSANLEPLGALSNMESRPFTFALFMRFCKIDNCKNAFFHSSGGRNGLIAPGGRKFQASVGCQAANPEKSGLLRPGSPQ